MVDLQRLRKAGLRILHDSMYGSGYGYGSIALEVARAAEETRPHAAIEIYQQHAEWLIALAALKFYASSSDPRIMTDPIIIIIISLCD